MNTPSHLEAVLSLRNGARFYRSALQVNPFAYLERHHKPTPFQNESAYNTAIIQACRTEGIEVIAVTDHYRVKTSRSLISAAKKAGLKVFPGFEAVTKDGVHFLCLFDLDTDLDIVERKIGDCGVHDDSEPSPAGKYDVREFLDECRKWGAACIAAHVAADQGGLLKVLKGQTRVGAWRDPHLFACSLPGPVSDAPHDLRLILENKNGEHMRDRPIAVLNSQDICSPDDLQKSGSSCWIKMSEVSIEGLRQAFLDPESRIRLASDPIPEEHTEFVAIVWQGGFLDGAGIHFSENLNVLIGGRGTGKSTVIESLRYALQLEPLGTDARKAHEGIVQQVLKSGTKVTLLVRSYRPNKRDYVIERTTPNPPVVRDESGNVLPVTPQDILPRVEIFGQHEVAELAKNPDKLTRLLHRFMESDPSLAQRKIDLRRELERSRIQIREALKELRQAEERLSALPVVEETLKRYQEAGLEERLKEQSLLVREERVLKTAGERLQPFRELLDQLDGSLPIDRTFVSAKALQSLPGHEILREFDKILVTFDEEMTRVAGALLRAIEKAEKELKSTEAHWDDRKQQVQAEYANILRSLQKSRIDGEEFLRLRRQIEELHPLRERKEGLLRKLGDLEQRRRNLLAEWEGVNAAEFQRLKRAEQKVNRQLANRVLVEVKFAGNREPLFGLLKEQVGGRLSETVEVLRQRPDLSPRELAETCRRGREELVRKFSIPSAQAERLAQIEPALVMEIEELDLPPTTYIKLNVAAEGQPPVWRLLDDLSTGQKATAVLLLLLLESDAPLVVDQPEDDLDNRFITEGVVPKMREEKRRRQFIFATHNANIPVLGDAELIVSLSAVGEAVLGRAEILPEHMGAIDSKPVQDLVKEVLEGGGVAFEMRRLKYGF
ncbi:MAG: TrlF family AAA-like ATPase [Candidatus Binatia bacterium]